jgi:hypothetical protein
MSAISCNFTAHRAAKKKCRPLNVASHAPQDRNQPAYDDGRTTHCRRTADLQGCSFRSLTPKIWRQGGLSPPWSRRCHFRAGPPFSSLLFLDGPLEIHTARGAMLPARVSCVCGGGGRESWQHALHGKKNVCPLFAPQFRTPPIPFAVWPVARPRRRGAVASRCTRIKDMLPGCARSSVPLWTAHHNSFPYCFISPHKSFS